MIYNLHHVLGIVEQLAQEIIKHGNRNDVDGAHSVIDLVSFVRQGHEVTFEDWQTLAAWISRVPTESARELHTIDRSMRQRERDSIDAERIDAFRPGGSVR